MVTAWHRGRVKFNRLLGNPSPESRTAHESARRFPHEIVEMIFAHLTCNLDTLKACSLTSRSWYIAAVPHVHHTLTLRSDTLSLTRDELKPLSKLDGLGLVPLVKEIRVGQSRDVGGWFSPRAFSHQDLSRFSAFANVRTLKNQELELYRFLPDVGRYFEHFSPTLQSITLFNPHCTPRQPSHFLSLFSNLDNVEIWNGRPRLSNTTTPNAGLVRHPTPKLGGRLALRDFCWVETWTHLITPCDGPRFHHIDLRKNASCAPILLEACAETLETLRFNARDGSFGRRFPVGFLRTRADSEQVAALPPSPNSIYRSSKFSDLYKSGIGYQNSARQTTPIPSSRRYSRPSHPLCSSSLSSFSRVSPWLTYPRTSRYLRRCAR